MSHSYTRLLAHLVFSTKDRKPLIDTPLELRLFPYLGGVIRKLGGTLIGVNGIADHVHLLAALPPSLAVAEAVAKIKANSSHWVHDTFPELRDFWWQRGYGGFSVSESGVDSVMAYINRQKVHHRKTSFHEEWRALLKRHKIPFDERYLWT